VEEGQARLRALVELERAARADIEQKLAHATAALQEAEERHRAAMAAAAEQMARHQAQYEIGMARSAATWEMVDEQLREAAIEVERSRREQASAAATVERLSRRESELSSLLAEATAARLGLEGRLAERERDLETQIEQEIEKRNGIEKTLAQAVNDLASRVADVERLTEREAELTSMLADATTSHSDLERRFAATEAAFEDASARATRERLAAARKAAEREAELDGEIQQERAARAALEQAVADAHAALHDAQQRHDAALTASASELADRQAQFDRELTQTAADRDDLAQKLTDAEVALDQVRRDYQSAGADVERLTGREADLTSRLADVQADRDSLAHRLAEAAAAIGDAADREKALEGQLADRQAQFDRELTQAAADRDGLAQRLIGAEVARDALEIRLAEAVNVIADANQRAVQERAAAAQREANLEARLAQALDARDALERTLAEARAAALDAERSFNEEANALRTHALEQAARFEARSADERLEHERRMAEAQDCNRHLMLERDALQQTLSAAEERLRRLDGEHREACERFERDRAAADTDIRRLTAERLETERRLEDAHRDQQAAEAARAEQQETFGNTLAARDHEIEHLQRTLAAANEALEAAKGRQEVLQAEADRVPRLQAQLDESGAESRRIFQQAPLAMFRCTRDGALIQANGAWTTLVRRRVEELRGPDFAAAVFESPGDLSWLIEHCLSTKAKESIETTVRRRDGARLFVRLSAYAPASDVIEIAVEDFTRLRVLQDRLGQAHRMEAVGRLASEVAMACGRLLNDVHQNVQQWLMDAGSSAASRQQREMLLDDLTRAAGQLQQLVAYGDKQTRTATLVDLNTVMRDLAPVLKRVAGDDVEVQLPDNSPSLNVDVETERVERVLVNLAAYGRERMPFGGRLTIEIGTSIVDRRFAAKYPNVRPGPHALITVTEMRRAARSDALLELRDESTAHGLRGRVARKPGVDLRTLQGLVGECGGHLWMRVQPLGDIVAKIRLPLLTSYDQTHPAAAGGRGRTATRWFQH
ncbi:MAG: hypothetical protein ACM3SQ_06555, partial [Betaproteobacteria bacterium]